MSDKIGYVHFKAISIQAVGAYIKNFLASFGKNFVIWFFSGPPNSIWFSCRSDESIAIVRVQSLRNPGEILEDLFL